MPSTSNANDASNGVENEPVAEQDRGVSTNMKVLRQGNDGNDDLEDNAEDDAEDEAADSIVSKNRVFESCRKKVLNFGKENSADLVEQTKQSA